LYKELEEEEEGYFSLPRNNYFSEVIQSRSIQTWAELFSVVVFEKEMVVVPFLAEDQEIHVSLTVPPDVTQVCRTMEAWMKKMNECSVIEA
jgi:hypothetical protein